MYLILEKRVGQKVIEHVVDDLTTFQTEPGSVYTIQDPKTGKPPKDLLLKKEGDDLLVEVDGEEVARIDDFFSERADAIFRVDGTVSPTDDMQVYSNENINEGIADGVLYESGIDMSIVGWTAGILGAGTAGVVVSSGGGDDTPTPTTADPTATKMTVVFDLLSSHSTEAGGVFEENVDYTIIIKVDSTSGFLRMQSNERWAGASNLGEGDKILVVGNKPSGIERGRGYEVTKTIEGVSGYGLYVNGVRTYYALFVRPQGTVARSYSPSMTASGPGLHTKGKNESAQRQLFGSRSGVAAGLIDFAMVDISYQPYQTML
ncbi:MAG: hypothetical protein OCC45_04180 [Desulfotalea sp.]